jgi:predicted dienelactone hydrolase
VGNRSFFFEDSSRDLSCGSGKRILLTEVWYPADPSAASLPENRVEDFLLGRAAEVAAALDGGLEEVNNLPTGSYRDATLRSDAPPLPMLFFSHGFMSNRFQSFTMASYLASHGYLVVAPDHICESKVTLTPTQVVQGSPLQLFTSLPVRVTDLRFLVKLFAENTPSPFGGRVDTSRIGLWGHSWGGLTASECIKVETRARALLQIASYGLYGVPPTLRAPSMYFWGKEEKVMSYFRSQHDSFIAAMPRPKYELEFFDTGHFAFSDLCEVIPSFQTNTNGCGTETRASGSGSFTNPPHDTLHAVLNAYATAFFGASFFGLSELRGYLSDNHFPAMMEYRVQR